MKDELIKYWPLLRAFLWRYVRTFLAAFIVTFGSMVQMVGGKEILGESLSMSFGTFLDTIWKISIYPATLSGIIAGISATAKLLRDTFGCGDGSSKIEKIPL